MSIKGAAFKRVESTPRCREVVPGGIEAGEVLFEKADDAVLLSNWRKGERDPLEFGDAKGVEAIGGAGNLRDRP